jgi:hypothetical protein
LANQGRLMTRRRRFVKAVEMHAKQHGPLAKPGIPR